MPGAAILTDARARRGTAMDMLEDFEATTAGDPLVDLDRLMKLLSDRYGVLDTDNAEPGWPDTPTSVWTASGLTEQ